MKRTDPAHPLFSRSFSAQPTGNGSSRSTVAASAENAANAAPSNTSCLFQGPRGCPGPRGPQGPQPPLSDAVDSPAQDVAASSLAVNTVYQRTRLRLSSDLTLYVRENGDNNADGYTEATAKATLAGAFAALDHIDPADCRVHIRIGPGRYNGAILCNPAYTENNLFIAGAGVEATYLAGERVIAQACGFSINHLAVAYLRATSRGCISVRSWSPEIPFILRFKSEQTSVTDNDRACEAREGGYINIHTGTTLQYEGRYKVLLMADFSGSLLSYKATHEPVEGMRADQCVRAAGNGDVLLYNSSFAPEGWNIDASWTVFGNGSLNVYGGTLEDVPGNRAYWTSSSVESIQGARGTAVACGFCLAEGSLSGQSFGVSECTRLSAGTYRVDLRHILGSAHYPVIALPDNAGEEETRIVVLERTVTSVTFRALLNGRATDTAFSFAVYS